MWITILNLYDASATQKAEALEAYQAGGTEAMMNYVASQKDGMNTEALMDYVEKQVIPSGTVIKKTKQTMNGFLAVGALGGRIDSNDEFEVTYPDGTTKTVLTKDLPEAVQKRVNGLKKDEVLTW